MTTRVYVMHASYGCDTGCCGHAIELHDVEARTTKSAFDFSHPYSDDYIEFAKELVRDHFGEEHVADLDWQGSVIVDD